MLEMHLQQESVMVCDLAIHCLDEKPDLIPEFSFRHGFNLIRRRFTLLQQSHDHRFPRYTKDIGRNRRELDVRILQDLMDPVFVAGPLSCKLLPCSGKISQLSDVPGRDEARGHESIAKQSCNPPSILPVGF